MTRIRTAARTQMRMIHQTLHLEVSTLITMESCIFLPWFFATGFLQFLGALVVIARFDTSVDPEHSL